MRRLTIALVTLLGITCCGGPAPNVDRGSFSVAEALGAGNDTGFARALGPRSFSFPEDHGAHPDFRTEWWYFTGNLSTEDGAEYGFQWTLFRHALSAQAPARSSRWATRDVWFAHLALGDATSGRFYATERFERGALDLAGARAHPFAAWIGDWRVASVDVDSTFPLALRVGDDSVALELTLAPLKPIVLQGDRGYSRKGADAGNASFYYSLTRLAARGAVTVEGMRREVEGSAWLDREWSTSVLSEGQVGWDWFSIQLDDGRELMLYRLRRDDGSVDPFNSGMLVSADGSQQRFGPDEIRYRPGRRWTSPISGGSYPVEWTLVIEPLRMELEIEPLLDASELDLTVRYWEGAIRVRGRESGSPVAGQGFLEMTGYESRGPATGAAASRLGKR